MPRSLLGVLSLPEVDQQRILARYPQLQD